MPVVVNADYGNGEMNFHADIADRKLPRIIGGELVLPGSTAQSILWGSWYFGRSPRHSNPFNLYLSVVLILSARPPKLKSSKN